MFVPQGLGFRWPIKPMCVVELVLLQWFVRVLRPPEALQVALMGVANQYVPLTRMSRLTFWMSRCPVKAMVMSISLYRISSARVTPASPYAPKP